MKGGRLGTVDNVLQVCLTPPSLASGSAVPAGATPAWGEGPSGQRGLRNGRGTDGGGGVGGGVFMRDMTQATLDLHHMIQVKGGG